MTEELSPRAAAERLGATTRSVQRWIATGRLPARRVGGRWRVAVDALDAFNVRSGTLVAAHEPIRRLFVANRGEIAARIGRTAQRLGIVAIVPPTDGPDALDLLSIDAVVVAARAAEADALHPGFGFLAENAAFAEAVETAGIRWVGPPPAAIRTMGDKAAARRLAASLGVPIVPGYDGADQSDAALARAARRIGLPLLVKPAGGGGGKGMRVVREPGRLKDALAAARREAGAAFGDERLILERLLEGPRHVEVQVLFDGHGDGVHLGERDCSVQRRNQKVLEETPSPAVNPSTRRRLTDAALELAGAVGYRSAGTCEFLLDDAGEIHFLEMNTRLQVEHPVTELVTGRDLVADQLRIAAGEPLGFGQADVALHGHAIEVRLYAEDADAGFLPATGTVEALNWPTGPGVRVDAGVEVGTVVGGRFDPLLAKIVAHGAGRAEALDRLVNALDETVVLGLTTNLRFLRWLVRQPVVRDGEARIDTLERIWPPDGRPAPDEPPDEAWQIAAAVLGGGWRLNADPIVRIAAGDAVRTVAVAVAGHGADADPPAHAIGRGGESVHVDVGGRSIEFRRAPPPDVDAAARAAAAHGHVSGAAEIVAPMPGSVVALHAAVGDRLEVGAPIVTLEAMKMEHAVASPIDARLAELHVGLGDQVVRGQLLGVLEA
ncbi:MAG TPA: biotin carboxylase N-terminal domain-containing protein [Candidatus Limnocylindrales bacterium]|nr:biotin carboxylase N-terminal domain-containing protein [Candidatus Limnocylindrales bacterium]